MSIRSDVINHINTPFNPTAATANGHRLAEGTVFAVTGVGHQPHCRGLTRKPADNLTHSHARRNRLVLEVINYTGFIPSGHLLGMRDCPFDTHLFVTVRTRTILLWWLYSHRLVCVNGGFGVLFFGLVPCLRSSFTSFSWFHTNL